jgi:hypothetical protein
MNANPRGHFVPGDFFITDQIVHCNPISPEGMAG